MVTPVAQFKIASSRTKILHLIVLRSNLKTNLQISASNFTHRDLHPENVKFDLNSRRFASAKQCRHIKSVVGGGGLKGVGSDFASACSCEHGEAKLSPHPLYNKVKNNLRWLFLLKEAKLAIPNLAS